MSWIWRHKGLALLFSVIAICVVFNPRPIAPGPSAGNCQTITVASNGFHTNLYLPAALFPDAATIRTDWPTAKWFVVGWGDEGFYRQGPTVTRAIDAVIPPSPTVLHVIATSGPPEAYFLDDAVTVALSNEGAAVISQLLEDRLARDEDGDVIRLSDGHYPGTSRFYRAKGSYHAFHTCNQWLAGVLRRAGVPINAPSAIPAQGVMWQLKWRAQQSCPDS